jgi:hypothetical protein
MEDLPKINRRAQRPKKRYQNEVQENLIALLFVRGDRGGTVVKVLRYKSEGRWFDSRWCHWNFSLT